MNENDDNQNLAVINFIKSIYDKNKFIPLHEPKVIGNEKKYLSECIDSTFVSSVGKFVDDFEYKSWVNKINKIFNDNNTIRKISENAKNTVVSNYKLKKLYDYLNQITL